MEELKVFILGIIQGLSEFLPVSSSGHIEIFKFFLNVSFFKNNGLLLTLVLHFATALSTIWVFRNEITKIIKTNFKERNFFLLCILVSMIPAIFVGLFFEKQISVLFDSNILLVGLMLIITSIFLYKTDNINSDKVKNSIDLKSALLIGIVQALAILPGLSRSGLTIAVAVFIGINKSEAAKFSFLMVVPLIFGSMAKSLIFLSKAESLNFAPSLLIGFFSAFFTGVVACRLMIKIVENSKLKFFSIYCLIIGFSIITYGII